ncbi:uncharacterized protein LOC34619368 [Cyclospora cayetanensis]|uniref:histone acetyltransferase n=1 Tax=Cyclospora cayetanensis TaxID=88456 RepID=A0A6P6S0D3_9EIME|nr:uncharacterized protein LOC34619368 [Cyclospora cayetanensis]
MGGGAGFCCPSDPSEEPAAPHANNEPPPAATSALHNDDAQLPARPAAPAASADAGVSAVSCMLNGGNATSARELVVQQAVPFSPTPPYPLLPPFSADAFAVSSSLSALWDESSERPSILELLLQLLQQLSQDPNSELYRHLLKYGILADTGIPRAELAPVENCGVSNCSSEGGGEDWAERAAAAKAVAALPGVYIHPPDGLTLSPEAVNLCPTQGPPEQQDLQQVLQQMALAAAAAFEVLDLQPPAKQHASAAVVVSAPDPAEATSAGSAKEARRQQQQQNTATENSDATRFGRVHDSSSRSRNSTSRSLADSEGKETSDSIYSRAAASGFPPFRSYREVYKHWKLFQQQLLPAGFSHSLFFGRSFVFHVLQQQLPALLPLLRAAGGATLSDKSFMTGLCSLIGMKQGLFDAIYKRFISKKAVFPESVLPSETGLGFLQRDAGGALEEEMGVIHFCCCTNDRRSSSLTKLISAKNIFSRQLPKMPRDYIARLVLDRSHFTFCLCKKDRVVGGVCFRPYFQQRFAEIAFLAVTSTEQVKGYGTRLMSHLKEFVKKSGIEYFLTYADNFAVGYFRKQGFTSRISLPRDRWLGYIKDYDGGTLMECRISSKVDYLRLSALLDKQRKAAEDCIEESTKRVLMPGLDIWQKDPSRVLQPSEIPGLIAAGYKEPSTGADGTGGPGKAVENGSGAAGGTAAAAATAASSKQQQEEKQRRSLKNQIAALLCLLDRHPSSWPFRRPVSVSEAPDYYEVVKHPIDISSMRRKNKSGGYRTKQELGSDMVRMFENCRLYNNSDTIYYKYADELQQFIWPKYEALSGP